MTRSRTRKGLTLLEVMVGLGVMLLGFALCSPMIRTTGMVWNQTVAETTNKELLSQAILRMSPTLRNTLLVDTVNSTATKLKVILPKMDALTGDYVYPVQNGDVYCFYLSDTSGSTSAPGTILWRSVNGNPDTSWSLRSGKGRIDFGTSKLSFSFDNPADPSLVTLSVQSVQVLTNKNVSASASAVVLFRNHQISGL